MLKARDTWPRGSRVYCHPYADRWPGEVAVEETPVTLCRRRGSAIDLVLDRPRLARSQFVFTEVRGRPAILWQTQKTARAANPGARVPRRRALVAGFTITIDTRERYPFRFAGRDVSTERVALPAGDYGVSSVENVIAVVERKTIENFASSLSDGTLAFQMQRLSEVPLAAIVVEGRYASIVALSTPLADGSPTSLHGSRFALPRSRWCSPIHDASRKSGPIDSSRRHSPIPRRSRPT